METIRYGDNFDQSQGLQLRFDNWLSPSSREVQNNDILVAAEEGEKQIPLTHMPLPLSLLLLPVQRCRNSRKKVRVRMYEPFLMCFVCL